MTKPSTITQMTAGEQITGAVFLTLYLIVLPIAAEPGFQWLEKLLQQSIPASTREIVHCYLLFAVTLLLFYGFLGQSLGPCKSRMFPQAMLLGVIGWFGVDELTYRLFRLIPAPSQLNHLNDAMLSIQTSDTPRLTCLMMVLVAPFVEEVLFRGLVFGNLRPKHRWAAYGVSCLLFALSQTRPLLTASQDAAAVMSLLQYLAPGMVLAWCYERSETVWTPIAVRWIANALCLFT